MALNPIFKRQVLLKHGVNVKIKNRFSKWLFPYNAERMYERQLVGLFRKLKKVTKEIVYPQLDFLVSQSNSTRPDDNNLKLDSSWVDNVKEIYNKTRFAYDSDLTFFIDDITIEQAERVSAYNKAQLIKVLHSALQVNPILEESYLESQLKSFQANNVSLITKLSDEQANKMEEILFRNLSSGNGVEAIKKEIEKMFNATEFRARLIARDQTNKFNGNLTELRQKDVGIDKYLWSTSLDERVRPTHKANEGKIFSWDNPPTTGHPGSAIQCRCIAQPIIRSEMFD